MHPSLANRCADSFAGYSLSPAPAASAVFTPPAPGKQAPVKRTANKQELTEKRLIRFRMNSPW